MGREDSDGNLITACMDCNAGKSNRILGAVRCRPDSDAKYLATQQEIAEMRLYLHAKQDRDELRNQMAEAILDTWGRLVSRWYLRPDHSTLINWLAENEPADIEDAIRITAWMDKSLEFGKLDFLKCVSGVLGRKRNERNEVCE